MAVIDPKNILGGLPVPAQPADGPKISAITPSKRDPERLHIYVDGKYVMTVNLMVLAEARLKVGETMPTQRVSELQQAERYSKLYDRALFFLTSRPRSEHEVIAKLKEVQRKAARPQPVKRYQKSKSVKQGFGRSRYSKPVEEEVEEPAELEEVEELELELDPDLDQAAEDADDPEMQAEANAVVNEEMIERIMNKLREQKLVDDLAFAMFWISNRQQFRPSGERLLKMELRQKRIADDVIVQALEQYAAERAAEAEREQELATAAATLSRASAKAAAVAAGADEDEDEDDQTLDEEAFDDDATPEQRNALAAARKKLRTYANLDRLAFKRRLGSFLQRRGYGFATISYVTDKLWNELQDER